MNQNNAVNVNKAEFFGMMTAVFSFLFVVHVAPTVKFPWFHKYITIVIVIVQFICLLRFFQYCRKRR